jgi:histidinol-phosphatase
MPRAPGYAALVTPDLQFALDLADIADGITLPHFRGAGLGVEIKPDLSPVTVADRATEAALRERIARERPEDAVLGEEAGASGAGARRRWVIDPIDGTRNFVRGVPVWATLIAMESDGEVTVGVVSAPALGRHWWAARGQGAQSDRGPIRVSAVEKLEEAYISTTDVAGFDAVPGLLGRYLDLVRRCYTARGLGDFWSHVLVAEGAVDIGVEMPVAPWDIAAAKIIVEEAGGRLTDIDGAARIDGGSVVTSNGLLHDAVLRALH